MKQKVVIRVTLNYGKNPPHLLGWLLKKKKKNYNSIKNDQSKAKAMKIASKQSGVESVSIQGEDHSQIVVVGDGINSVILISLLRKKVGFSVLTSISEVEKPKQETKPSESGIQSMVYTTRNHSVRSISLSGIMSKCLVDTTSIASIFPPDRSDTESDTSSESYKSSPRFSCSIDAIFPPARSPSDQSLPRFSFSIETFFPPARSPSQSDSSENYEEIFPIDPFIATSSRRTRPMRVVKALVQAEVKVQAQDGNAEAGEKAACKRPVVYL